MIENIGLALLVFGVAVLIDILIASYTMKLADKKINTAAVLASISVLASGINTKSYVDHFWLIIPFALGAGVGTKIAGGIEDFLSRRFSTSTD